MKAPHGGTRSAGLFVVLRAPGIDTALVSSHNVVRIILVIALAPPLFGLIRRRVRTTRPGDGSA